MPSVGPRVDEIVFAEYGDDLRLHERYVLGVVSDDEILVVTPHWDMCVEPLSDYAELYRPGPQGGYLPEWPGGAKGLVRSSVSTGLNWGDGFLIYDGKRSMSWHRLSVMR